MLDTAFISYLLTVLLINISPGPAMMFVIQQSTRNGARFGLMSALGVEIGVLVYVLLSSFGMAKVFVNYPEIYQGILLLGGLYLLYLSYLVWPKKGKVVTSDKKAVFKKESFKSAFTKGLLINLTNPKIALFFVSLIPQFVPKDSSANTFLLYGLIFNVGGIIVNFLISIFSVKASRLLSFRGFDYMP